MAASSSSRLELGDARLELVHAPASMPGLALVAGGAVAAGQLDELGQQRSPASRTNRRTALSVHPIW